MSKFSHLELEFFSIYVLYPATDSALLSICKYDCPDNRSYTPHSLHRAAETEGKATLLPLWIPSFLFCL